jgi:hypothetical protein
MGTDPARGWGIVWLATMVVAAGCGGSSTTDAGPDQLPDLVPDVPSDMGGGCTPFTAGTCPADERCAVVFARAADTGAPLGTLFACLPAEGARGLDAPCFGVSVGSSDPTVRFSTDNCVEGLLCAIDEQNIPRCVDLCDGSAGSCHDLSYCLMATPTSPFGTCVESDGCDVVYQTGCRPSEAYYTAPGTNGDLLGSCDLPIPLPGTVGGTPCVSVSDCPRGMDCLGPDGTIEGEPRCRVFCDPASSADAGVPGRCATGFCVAIPVDGTVQVPTVPGICR